MGVHRVSVEQCFVQAEFNDELPLYILDVGTEILVLFGQWLYDPHTLAATETTFKAWENSASFFQKFTLRCSAETGIVLRLEVEDSGYVGAALLPPGLRFKQLRECQLVSKSHDALLVDLERAGIVDQLR